MEKTWSYTLISGNFKQADNYAIQEIRNGHNYNHVKGEGNYASGDNDFFDVSRGECSGCKLGDLIVFQVLYAFY